MKGSASVLILLLCAAAAAAYVPSDVPRDHWAYEAVRDLADEGLVLGYPDGQFLGDRTLTRYEFATIVKRIVDQLHEKMEDDECGDTVSRITTDDGAAAGAAPEDVEKINKLVNEFKVELAVIGTRLDNVEATIEELKARMGSVETAVLAPEGALETARADISKLKQYKVGGYVQARYQTGDFDKEDKTEDSQPDTLLVRRARVKVTGNPTDKTTAVVQIDTGKNDFELKDSYIEYAFTGDETAGLSLRIGQQKWPFGYEVGYSSGKRETFERALIIRRLFPGERDLGLKLTSAQNSNVVWTLGVFNGTGTKGEEPYKDHNEHKDYLANVKFILGDLDLGISGYWGKGVWGDFDDKTTYDNDREKIRYGADLQYYLNSFTLKAEYVRARGIDESEPAWDDDDWVSGYYAQLNFNLNPMNTLVARYSSISEDPCKLTYGRRSAWDLGFVHRFDEKTVWKVFFRMNDEEFNEIDNDVLGTEFVVNY